MEVMKGHLSSIRRSVSSTFVCVVTIVLATGCTAGIKGRADVPSYIAKSPSRSVYAEEISIQLGSANAAQAAYCLADPSACPLDGAGSLSREKRLLVEQSVQINSSEDALARYRNNYLNSMMSAHELALQDYARQLSIEGRGGSFAKHLATLGLASAASITGSEKASSILNVLTTAVVGVGDGYNQEVLLGSTISALLNQMKADQSKKRNWIVGRMSKSNASYPLSAARLDITELGSNVSIDSAIAAIQEQAESAKKQAVEKENLARTISFSKGKYSDRLQVWFDVDDEKLHQSRIENAEAFLKKNNVSVSFYEVYSQPDKYAEWHEKLINEFNIP